MKQCNEGLKDNMDAPPLPCRWRVMQRRKSNTTATVAPPKANDGATTDTDSEYEYVSNSMKKRTSLKVCNFIGDKGQEENEDHRNENDHKSQSKQSNSADRMTGAVDVDCRKMGLSDDSLPNKSTDAYMKSKQLNQGAAEAFSMHNNMLIKGSKQHGMRNPLLHEGDISSGDKAGTDNTAWSKGINDGHGHDFPHCSNPSKGTDGLPLPSDNIILCKGVSRQDIHCLHPKDKNNDGYQKLTKATEKSPSHKHEYQKLNKLTMEPYLGPVVTLQSEPQCSKVQQHTIWREYCIRKLRPTVAVF